MCIAIPARVIKVCGLNALVERYSEQLEVSLLLLEEAVAPGDYLILQARAWAVEKITAAQAREAYRLFDELFAANASDGVNPAIWLDD